MKIAHWTIKNGSGMHRMADDLSAAERELGIDSVCQMSDTSSDWEGGMGADIHIAHSHVPDAVRKPSSKIVWFGHGTPEHCFQSPMSNGQVANATHGDSFMLAQYWMQHADALVTFWPRHAAIWQSMCDKNTLVDTVPMGINTTFWSPVESRGKYVGSPSLMTAENAHYFKWPLDILIAWPWITEHVPDARLHVYYLPLDQHRWWFPLVNRNGASFKSYLNGGAMSQEDLRNAFVSTDYYVNPVKYGDYNRMTLEAKASGATVISHMGNEYADYHIPEGDQRVQAAFLIKILKGEIEKKETKPVPSIKETAQRMKEIYERIA